jgi:hypothetical protein
MDSTNTLYDSLEEFRDQKFNFINLTDLEHFLQLCQKERFLDAVSEGPEF